MASFIKKFKTTQPDECILHLPEIKEAIKKSFGETQYQNIENNQSIMIEISAILCDSPTQIEIRHTVGKPTLQQDLIGDCVFTYPRSNVASIISTKPTSGTVFLVME